MISLYFYNVSFNKKNNNSAVSVALGRIFSSLMDYLILSLKFMIGQ